MIGQLDSSIIVLPRWCPGTLDGPLPAVGTARLQALDGTGLSIGRHQDRTASIYHYNIYIYSGIRPTFMFMGVAITDI
jgi:hypothetical protein